ncbi:MAG: hypothetical protein N4A35_07175 [Flavobacteriales bacterium]|jgi:DNA-binding CsgD family transcriptional regulator|nr:hypothetical protein [Flavobacteriales bacterium]
MRFVILSTIILLPFIGMSSNNEVQEDSILINQREKLKNFQSGKITEEDQKELARIYVKMAQVYADKYSMYDTSLYYFQKANQTDLKNIAPSMYSKIMFQIANVYSLTDKIDLAIVTNREAMKIGEAHKDTSMLIRTNWLMGKAYYNLDLDSSLYFFTEANHFANAYQDVFMLQQTFRALGQVYIEKKNYDSALVILKKIPLESIGVFSVCNLKLQFAMLYLNIDNTAEALRYALDAKSIADSLNNISLIKNSAELLQSIYIKDNNYLKAYEAQALCYKMKDSIKSLEVQKNIEELTIKYDVELKEEKNKQLKSALIAINLKSKNERFIMVIILLIVLIVFGVLYYRYTTKKRRLIVSDMKVKLSEATRRELMGRLKHSQHMILEKNNLINRLKEDINENVESGEKTKRLLDKLHTKNEWSEFLVEFELLHTGFFSKLNQIAKEPLTKNDTRLSALVKLNLSNKEISDLLFVSEAAVKKGKNRLTKKIELEKGERLSSYMNKL